MEDTQKGFTWMHILAHTLIITAISAVVIFVISRDVYASVSDYISGVGSAASVYAIAITLWQLRQVKRVAQAAKDAALQKSEEIESFLTYADQMENWTIKSFSNILVNCRMCCQI